MRILLLTQVLPYPLDAGPKTRAYYVMRALALTHEVTLLSFVRPSDSPEAVAHLRSLCAQVETVPITRSRVRDGWFLARSLMGRTPFVIARDHVPAMHERIRSLVQSGPFDAVHADQLWMAPYALAARDLHPAGARPCIVLDQHNATWRIFDRLAVAEPNPAKRYLLTLESRKLARYEAEICRRFDAVVWVTQEDVSEMAAVSGGIEQVPNSGVIPICNDAAGEPPVTPSAHPRRVTFLGGLHYPPNAQGILWFAANVFPRILERVPDARLTVIGRQPPDALARLGIPEDNLDIPGFVDDPLPYLQDTAAFVVPLLAGGGMRVKIVDGWRWGLPIVSTTVGAEGIRYEAEKHLLLADEPDSFADAVVRLLCDPALRQSLGETGRLWVEQQYDWRAVYGRWEDVYRQACAGHAARSAAQ